MSLPRIAILIDLPRGAGAGGHVKYWERIAQAAARQSAPRLDLTFYFSGSGPDETIAPHVRYRYLPPVFSSARLTFLPYIPAHTDLAPFHGGLAAQLPTYDVVHTTDAFFAFARTAERIARWNKIPLATSFHTDTPAYAELFTRATLEKMLGRRFGGWLGKTFAIPKRERASKEKRLRAHLQACDAIMAMRVEDIAVAAQLAMADKVHVMHLGVDKELFAPNRRDRNGVERDYGIAPGKFITLFVGRVDAGKNMPVLLQACLDASEHNVDLHLIVAGEGPLTGEIKQKLGGNATLAGLIAPEKLARLYASVDCLAIASDIEIGGMIGLEAMAAGCPVLVSERSGVAQLCGDTSAMRKVAPGAEAWTDALTQAARDPAALSVMRDAAFGYRREALLSWDDVLDRDFMPVWLKLAENKAAGKTPPQERHG